MDTALLHHFVFGLSALANFFIAAYVIFQKPRRLVHRAFFIFAFGIALWEAGLATLSLTRIDFFITVALWGGFTMILGLFLMSRTFPDGKRLDGASWAGVFPFFFFYAATPFGLFVETALVHPDGGLEPVNGPLIFLMVIFVGAYIAFSSASLFLRYRRSSGLAKLQMKYLLAGIAAFVTVMFFANVLLPALGVYRLNFVGPLASIAFLAFTAYAVVRHQLMDIRFIIQRSMIYSLLFAVVVGFYLALVFVLGTFLGEAARAPILISAGAAAVLGAFGVPPLERRFRRATDKFFFKDRYDYAEAVYGLSRALNQNLELDALVRQTTEMLKKIFKTKRADVVLAAQNPRFGGGANLDKAGKSFPQRTLRELERRPEAVICSEIPRILEDENPGSNRREALREIQSFAAESGAEAVVPLATEGRLAGILVLGGKMSGEPYTVADVKLLETFSHQAAVAVRKAELYKRAKDRAFELEAAVKERTAELERKNEAERQTIVELSHSLQTPLTVAKIEVESMKAGPRNLQAIKQLEESIDKVSQLIYQLLKLANLEFGAHEPKKSVFDLSHLLGGVVEYASIAAKDKGVSLASRIESGAAVFGNEKQIEELIINLLGNAVKYSENSAKKKISVFLEKKMSRAELVIEDAGSGIAEEDLPHIFESFYRSANAENARGSGLGLAIAKKIAEKHGGTIEAQSKSGAGARFVVRLPLAGKE